MTIPLPAFRIAALLAALAFVPSAVAQAPAVGPNVNMVSGTKWPQGDPFLTKQNEPSLGISSRNPLHLLAGVNDYRLVPAEEVEGVKGGKGWIQIYKSVDGGATWRSTPLGGCPLSVPECTDPTGLTAAVRARTPTFSADPTVRAGPHGTFFLNFIAGQRAPGFPGLIAVQRFVDRNDDIQRATDLRSCTPGSAACLPVYDPPSCTGAGAGCTLKGHFKIKPAEDPIVPDVVNIVQVGTPGQFNDKPWLAVDVGRRSWNGSKTCELLSWTKSRTDVTNAAQTVGAFNVYLSYAVFTGDGTNEKPAIYVATSSDCGNTFGSPIKISNPLKENQGSTSAVDPLNGHVYVAWRNHDGVDGAIYVSKSADGGKTWSKTPILVARFNYYDQGATSASFRTLGFPSLAVSVKNGQSKVHITWAQRKVAPNATPPYSCPAANAADCDARVVIATSTNGGTTWGTPVAVDPNVASPTNPANPNGRGHQVQPSLTFSAGKLLVTWLDQRLDHTEGVLVCPPGPACTNVSELVEVRRPARNSNLDPACHIDVTKPPLNTLPPSFKNQLDQCYNPDAVWTTYITDGTQGLVRRHTLDTYAAMGEPDTLQFTSKRVSQYTFGTTVQGAVNPDGSLTPQQGVYDIVQKEVNPPNLPMFANGTAAFIGDYIDVVGQNIVATGDATQPYKFNVGGAATGPFVTGGFAPFFQVMFTDNRDVIPPLNGDWTNPTCTTTAFKKDANGNVIGVDPTVGCGAPGYAGNRNANVYTAAIAQSSIAFAGTNSKLLNPTTPRGFVVTVRNFGDSPLTYNLTLPAPTAALKASFNVNAFPSGTADTATTLIVQPKSSSARTVWVTSSAPTAKITVSVASTDVPQSFSSQLLLNPDANAPLVTNGDGTSAANDTANDDLGSVVLSNAVLTNNALSNNALTNAVLSNNALTNAALSNVVLSNAVLSNLDPVTAALSNNALTNAVLSNVVLSNAVLSNNALSNAALSNAVLSNVVLSNTAVNVALTNVDPANVALSNAVLSNNALTNVVLSNASPNAALSNAMLTNAVLSNAALSNVVLSNAALSNNALSNDPLRSATLSNAPLGDAANGGDPQALRTIETGSAEIAKNAFQAGDLANSNFKETTFTIRNRGNIDTVIAIKLMLRDAVCSGAPNYVCTTPSGYKLQLVLRKITLVPVAIPPTGPAVDTGRAIRIGLAQSNTEVSNVSDLPLIDPDDPNFGKFLPEDPNAAMLSLGAGEYAYATIRAIGVGGATPPDPADLLRWGVKTVAADATGGSGPLVIRTLNFPATPAFVTLTPATPTLRTFGGTAPIAGSAVCSDAEGNAVLTGVGAPASTLGALGNFYIDAAAQTLYGPKTASGWGSGTSLIVNGLSGPQASVPCPPNDITIGAFTTDASFNSIATVSFTPKYWGDFYMLANVSDASSPTQTDRQVIKVTVQPRPPVLTYTGFPMQLTFNQGIDLAPLVSSDSKNGADVPQPILFSTDPLNDTCHIAADGHTLVVDHASPPACVVTIKQNGNEIYAPVTQTKSIDILQAAQTIVIDSIPSTLTYNNFGAPAATLVAHPTSTTAPNSGLAVTFTTQSPIFCATGGANGAQITIAGAGTCTIRADQSGNRDYLAATLTAPAITINRANQTLTFGAAPTGVTFGDPPVTVSATSSSPTAPASTEPITFMSQTPAICTNVGGTVTIVAAGTCTIAANQAGNANYNAAPQVTQSFTVNQAPTAFIVAAQQFTLLGSPSTTITGKLNRTDKPTVFPPDAATVLLKKGAATINTYAATPVAPDGVLSITDSIAADSYTLVWSYPGNTNFLAATSITTELRVEGFSAAAAMGVARAGHTSTLLADGNVLIVAGTDAFGAPNAAAEIYCAVASAPCGAGQIGTFVPITTGLTTARSGHTATRLSDGNVLVSGGSGAAGPITSTEVYCAVATGPLCTGNGGKFMPAAAMGTARSGHAANLLGDGTVLITGGVVNAAGTQPTNTTEVYCTAVTGSACTLPAHVGTFQPSGAMGTARANHTATLLSGGNVLVTGGAIDAAGTPANTAEVYGGGVFLAASGTMTSARKFHSATLLADNRVLVAGGDSAGGPTVSADVYCPVTVGTCAAGTFAAVGNLGTARAAHTSTVLTDDFPLVVGGRDASGPLATAELFDTGVNMFASAGTMASTRSGAAATRLGDGRVLVTGGRAAGNVPTNSAELFNGPF